MKTHKSLSKFFLIIISGILIISISGAGKCARSDENDPVQFEHEPEQSKIDVYLNHQFFTSYVYSDTLPKPVLYPIQTSSEKILTRGYPIQPRPNERTDHPHHMGFWLNYGDVNGLDFWNNSDAIPPEKKHEYGYIQHKNILAIEEENDKGVLEVFAEWKNYDDEILLTETTHFEFFQKDNLRIIDRITTLQALDEEVRFNDNKEGMVAVRVARQLELPSDKPASFTDSHGNVTEEKVMNNEGVTGNYLSSEGTTGNDVWGTRARWVKLFGEIEDDPVSLTLIDHPGNAGYPTYWHARGYGLFAANPLGQEVFSDGEQSLNFSLDPGESVTFKYRLVVADGAELDESRINALADEFADMYQ